MVVQCFVAKVYAVSSRIKRNIVPLSVTYHPTVQGDFLANPSSMGILQAKQKQNVDICKRNRKQIQVVFSKEANPFHFHSSDMPSLPKG